MTEVTQDVLIGKQSGLGRRSAGKALFAAFVGAAGARILPHVGEIVDSAQFIIGRERLDPREVYTPPNPELMLTVEQTNRIFETLGLLEEYPNTLTKEAFHIIAQRPARLASLFFRPADKGKLSDEAAFGEHCDGFFRKIKEHSDNMKVDFVGTLLMFQVSGDANNSIRAQQKDVQDERFRVGGTIGRAALGSFYAPLAIGALRTFEVGQVFAYARTQGPVTLGIHDIETVMIARGLESLEVELPEQFALARSYLEKRAPRFAADYQAYLDRYRKFDSLSGRIAQDVVNTPEIQLYLSKYYSKELLRTFLRSGDEVDSYQFSTTTVLWAILSELQQTVAARAYDPFPKTLENFALERAVAFYLEQSSPTGFFLDQINNPKMIARLAEDAKEGNPQAKRLFNMALDFQKAGDEVIKDDREIAKSLVEERTEQDVEFQLLTGVAYARWLLSDAWGYTHGTRPEEIRFDNSQDLAYHAFLANLNRENAPIYQLAGVRPLNRASLVFGLPRQLFESMDRFIDRVYRAVEQGGDPRRDFRAFAWYFTHLIEEPYAQAFTGTSLGKLSGDKKLQRFIALAKEFGAYRTIVTPPHCSSMRALETTIGYGAEMASAGLKE